MNLAQRGIGLLLVNLGTDIAHILYAPVVSDVAHFSDSTIIDVRRIG